MNTKIKNEVIYDIVNKTIFTELEKGNIPWKRPWTTRLPVNLVSKHEYRGFNWWVLMLTQEMKQYKSNIWASYKQIADKGGKVKKGEKATDIIYWKLLEVNTKYIDKKTGKNRIEKIPLLRYYRVFNLDQTIDIKIKKEEYKAEINTTGDEIINNYKKQIDIRYGGSEAFYQPREDYIQIPIRSDFKGDSEFYATHFHEMTHSTGHEKRLNRFKEDNDIDSLFGSQSYSKEELVAEMGSAYLCAKINILPTVVKNKTAYIQSWLKVLKNDKTLLISAAGKAQRAVNFILQ